MAIATDNTFAEGDSCGHGDTATGTRVGRIDDAVHAWWRTYEEQDLLDEWPGPDEVGLWVLWHEVAEGLGARLGNSCAYQTLRALYEELIAAAASPFVSLSVRDELSQLDPMTILCPVSGTMWDVVWGLICEGCEPAAGVDGSEPKIVSLFLDDWTRSGWGPKVGKGEVVTHFDLIVRDRLLELAVLSDHHEWTYAGLRWRCTSLKTPAQVHAAVQLVHSSRDQVMGAA